MTHTSPAYPIHITCLSHMNHMHFPYASHMHITYTSPAYPLPPAGDLDALRTEEFATHDLGIKHHEHDDYTAHALGAAGHCEATALACATKARPKRVGTPIPSVGN